MKLFFSTPLSNIKESIIGKITFVPVKKSLKKDFVLVGCNGKTDSGYAALIVTQHDQYSNENTILAKVEDIKHLSNGDIVSIETNGNVQVLYEKNSIHNFLLVTEQCNCRCIMCPNPVVVKEDSKLAAILKVISLIDQDAQLLGITGGEPTLLGDGLIDIINACKVNLPRTKLILLTNGIKFADFDYVKKIALVQHPHLTIDIPIHSDTDIRHNNIAGVKGFYKSIQGLYHLALFNQKIGIRIVIHKLNYNRLHQIAEFVYRNFPFVFHIAFMQMEPMEIAKANIDKLWIDPYDYNDNIEKAVLYLNRRDMNVSIYNAQLCILPKCLWDFSKKSISSWKNIYLEECMNCAAITSCGGFFASSLKTHSRHIKAIKTSLV